MQQNKNIKIKLSEQAILFLKTYAIPELKITTKIDDDLLDEIISIASLWESEMVNDEGYDRKDDYPEKERNEMADKFVTEASAQIVDLDDLNARLNL